MSERSTPVPSEAAPWLLVYALPLLVLPLGIVIWCFFLAPAAP